uniref:non-specific serine/threonine protein kinase n=1 Tax=Saccoglossus kowalevskii TaxID=10224 RepID=A0ABM0M6W2_SACKO|nr:PREDICTED: citron Rho-interacting kinase-like [Saccoglossus kowalevskii]
MASKFSNSQEPVVTRCSKLHHLFLGKTVGVGPRTLATRESLLDALFVLYDECSNDQLMRDKHISSFVNKYKSIINELRQLRLSINDFEVKNVIGRGHFGEVQVVREKSTSDVYAMKVLKKNETLSQENIAFFEEERDIMAKAKNAWITSLQYAFQDAKNLYLVMEFHPGGDLLSLLSRYDDIFEESMAKFYLAEMVVAIHSLHSMGYVHRDIKPDNILIDRTGHIKLADFGSSAKLSSTKTVTSKMPVGTPDYVAPEVLTSMNGKTEGSYGLECDWWSLGIVAYEMLFAKTPFTADSIVVTYSNIMDFKKSLHFPADITTSKDAKRIIKELLCDKEDRLGYEGLNCHAFFADIDWTTLRQSVPPFVPTIGSVDDTSNFDEFEPEMESPDFAEFRKKKEFSGKNLPFVGFTFTKNLVSSVSGDSTRISSITQECPSPAAKLNLERRLTVKTKELQETQEKFNKLQNQQSSVKDNLRTDLKEKTDALIKVQNERDQLEKDMAMYITEVKNLKRMLELEKKEHHNTDNQALQLLSDIKEQSQKVKDLKDELKKSEIDDYKQVVAQLEQDRFVSARRAERLEAELKTQHKENDESKTKIADLQTKLFRMKENTKSDVVELHTKLEKITEDSNRQIEEYRRKLEKAMRSSTQATDLLQNVRHSKEDLELELQAFRKQQNNIKDLEEKLQESEEERKSLAGKIKSADDRENKLNDTLKTKHQLTQDLSKQILELEDKYENEVMKNKKLYRTVEETERELEEKLQDYENKLKLARMGKKTVRFNLGPDHHDSSEDDVKQKMTDQQNTITMQEANIKVLEKQIEELTTAKHEKLKCETKEYTRVQEEKLADLQQEKMFLETQNSKLECKVKELESKRDNLKGNADEVESRLSETISHYESQLSELRVKHHSALHTANDNVDRVSMLQDSERKLKGKVEKLEKELNTRCRQSDEQITLLQEEKKEVETKFEKLKDSCSVIQDLEDELSMLAGQNTELNEQNLELGKRVDELKTENNDNKNEVDKLQDELTQKNHKCDGHELTISMLKSSCTMLEEQVLDLEALYNGLEEKTASWNDTKAALENEIEQLETRLKELQQALSNEKQARLYAESKSLELAETVEVSNKAHKVEIERLQTQLHAQKVQTKTLTENMNDLEKKHSLLDLSVKSLQRKYHDEQSVSENLRDDIAKLNTQVSNLKTSIFKLTQGLEEAVEKGELLKTEKIDLEDALEDLELQYSHEKIKLEATLAQQTKLIDFLQAKIQTPVKKKRKFGPGRLFHRNTKETMLPPSVPLQYKDLQEKLEKEKSGRIQLQVQVNKLEIELQTAKRETLLAKTRHGDISLQTPSSQGVVSAIMLSPSHRPSASSLLLAPGMAKTESKKDGALNVHRPKERMKHNIPHRFATELNMRATKCAVCMDSIHFGRQASKCNECHLVCHPKCSSLLPHTCGLPSLLMDHFSEALKHTASPAVCGNISTNDTMVQLEAWMKVPKPGKQGWDKKWVTLEGTKVCIYDKESSLVTIDEFDLCPSEGKVTVHAAVTPAELFNTASTDLPYIMRLELHPKTTCWPGRNMYFMAPSFSDKQKWMVHLESMVTSGNKMLGNTLIVLEGDQCIDINCTLLLCEQLLLVGAEEGLFAMELKKRETISVIDGVSSVFQMHMIEELSLILMIAGNGRDLCTIDYKHLKTKANQASLTPSTVNVKCIEDVKSCHLFAVGSCDGCVFICAAMPDKITVLKYNSSMGMFCVKKEMETAEPCSCIHFATASVLVGTDKFYEIDLKQYTVEDTVNYLIHVFFFSEFGVFVDEYGRRSRPEDLKWTRLPLAFAYRQPYLYVTHFNSLEVCEIPAVDGDEKEEEESAHTFMELANPRYVGPALTSGAIYIATYQEDMVELLCLQGNICQHSDENTTMSSSDDSVSLRSQLSSSKRPLSEVYCNQGPVRRSMRLKGSPSDYNPVSKKPKYEMDSSTQI